MTRTLLALGLAAGGVPVLMAGEVAAQVWRVDRLDVIGDHTVEVIGQPRVTDGAVEFDGLGDGLLIENLPIAGARTFTIEMLIRPDTGGPMAQRFLHLQDEHDARLLLELRTDGGAAWWLDSFLLSSSPAGGHGTVLIDPARIHPTGRWHWVALRHDGATLAHFVNGVRQGEARVALVPFISGRTSIGVRQNLVSWFRGAIREIRFTPSAVAETELQRINP